MMLRSGMRYLRVCGAVRFDGGSSLLLVRPLSSAPTARPCRSVAPVNTAAFAPLCVVTGARSNVGAVRLWSNRATDSCKETAPLTGASKTGSESDEEQELEQQAVETQSQQTTSWRQRAKTFAIEYGRVGICTHIVLSVLSFSVIYAGISSGVDVTALLDSVGLSSAVSDGTTNSAGSALIAYTIYKVVAPIRWPITFAVTPVVLRALRRRGYMLAADSPSTGPPTSPQ